MIQKTKFWKKEILEKVRHNPLLIPEELVERDYLTDSLLNKPFPKNVTGSGNGWIPKAVNLEIEKNFKNLFGFPHVIAVSQGRVAEAILGRLLVRNGHYLPGSALFPTTRIHQQLNGGTPLEIMVAEAEHPSAAHAFKGNLDLEALEKAIRTYHARWIPFIAIEPCNNAIGGHPISLENLREVHHVAQKYKIPLYLDATRIVENAYLIQEREPRYQDTSILEILLEMCSYADGLTMSATKDFPTPIGGFFATRDASLYPQALDFVMGFGSGLSYENKGHLVRVLGDYQEAFRLVRERMSLVKLLHTLIRGSYPVLEPVGGHGVFVDAEGLPLEIPQEYHPVKAFLYFLYKEYGIRASENPQSLKQEKQNRHFIRFAVPILGKTENAIRETGRDLLKALQEKDRMEGLEKTGEPPGLTGAMRAYYRPVRLNQRVRSVPSAA